MQAKKKRKRKLEITIQNQPVLISLVYSMLYIEWVHNAHIMLPNFPNLINIQRSLNKYTEYYFWKEKNWIWNLKENYACHYFKASENQYFNYPCKRSTLPSAQSIKKNYQNKLKNFGRRSKEYKVLYLEETEKNFSPQWILVWLYFIQRCMH